MRGASSTRNFNIMASGQKDEKNYCSVKSTKAFKPIMSSSGSGVCFSSKTEDDGNQFKNGKPTMAYAELMPKTYSSMRHEQIIALFAEGVPEATIEAVIRDVMAVDQVEYDEAVATFEEIKQAQRGGMIFDVFPYKLGLGTAVVSGVASFPLVFDLETVKKFNLDYVTADVPETKDLETWLEVGSWSWNWMEPLMGQVSFVLLVAQFARIQMINLGIKPYGNFMKKRRADRLVSLYPQYDKIILRGYSDTQTFY